MKISSLTEKNLKTHIDLSTSMVAEMMAIPGPSRQESKIIAYIVQQLRAAGLPESAITTDDAHKKSPHGGEIGNLIVKLPGTISGERRLFMAHADTVPLCVGTKPRTLYLK